MKKEENKNRNMISTPVGKLCDSDPENPLTNNMQGTGTRKRNIGLFASFALLFVALFIFFSYTHPVVPWDGDDWGILSRNGKNFSFYGLPKSDSTVNVFSVLLGSLAGHIAAFVVYPILDDYILSIMVVNAFVLAASITISIVFLLQFLLKTVERKTAIIGTGLFILLAFLIFKSHENSEYLYWQYNQCTTYWYSAPSYIASAFFLYMLGHALLGEDFKINLKNGVIFAVLYVIEFSFVPAALLIAALSVCTLIYKMIAEKKFLSVLRKNIFYLVAVIMFMIKVWLESFRTFGTGYLKEPTELLLQFKTSLQFFWQTISKFNSLFVIVSLVGIIMAAIIYIMSIRRQKHTELTRKFSIALGISVGSLFLVWMYFVLFGTVSLHHVSWNGIIRLDTCYVLYFLLIYIVVLCWSFVLHICRSLEFAVPLALFFMTFVVITPNNSFRDEYILDCTSQQRYKIMSAIVSEIKDRNDDGVYSIVVHMPPYGHYGGSTMMEDLFAHDITDQQFTIQFVYDAEPGSLYFE